MVASGVSRFAQEDRWDGEERAVRRGRSMQHWPAACVLHFIERARPAVVRSPGSSLALARDEVVGSCFLLVTRSNYRAYDMASIPPGVSMRAAVAGVCALLWPLLLAATLQAQEPERVIRGLDFVGNQVHHRRGARRGHQHHQLQLVRPQLPFGQLARPRREALLRRGGVPARRDPAARALPAERLSQRDGGHHRRAASRRTSTITFRITEGAPMVVTDLHGHRNGLAARLAPAHRRRSTSRCRRAIPSTATSCSRVADSIERRLRDRGYPSATRLLRLRGRPRAADRAGEPRGGSQRARGRSATWTWSASGGSTPPWCATSWSPGPAGATPRTSCC